MQQTTTNFKTEILSSISSNWLFLHFSGENVQSRYPSIESIDKGQERRKTRDLRDYIGFLVSHSKKVEEIHFAQESRNVARGWNCFHII